MKKNTELGLKKDLKKAKDEIKKKDTDIKNLKAAVESFKKESLNRQKMIEEMNKELTTTKKSLEELGEISENIPSDEEREKLTVIKDLNMEDLQFISGKMLSGGTDKTLDIYERMNI